MAETRPEPVEFLDKASLDAHKGRVRELYLEGNRSLEDVRRTFADPPYSLNISKWALESKLREWGYTKNLKSTDWPVIGRVISKRKRAGKESDVFLNGKLVSAKKVHRETLRNVDANNGNLLATSPTLPKGIRIRTPVTSPRPTSPQPLQVHQPHNSEILSSPPLTTSINLDSFSNAGPYISNPELETYLDYTWQEAIPSTTELASYNDEFFSFLDIRAEAYFDYESTLPSLEHDGSTHVSSHMDDNIAYSLSIHPAVINVLPRFQFREQIQLLSYNRTLRSDAGLLHMALKSSALEFRQDFLSSILSQGNTHDIPSEIQSRVPQHIHGEFQEEIRKLSDNPNLDFLMQMAELTVCIISNNITHTSLTKFMDWCGKDMLEDKFLAWLARARSEEIFRHVFNIGFPSMRATLEKLLESAARLDNAAALQSLLDTGISRDFLAGQRGLRLLQIAISSDSLIIAKKLIKFGPTLVIDTSKEYPFDEHPIRLAARVNADDVIEALVGLSEKISEPDLNSALAVAIHHAHKPSINILVRAGANVDRCTWIGISAMDSAYFSKKRGLYATLAPYSNAQKTSITPIGVASAASRGIKCLSDYITDMGSDNRNMTQDVLETALSFSVWRWSRNKRATTVLLDFGVDPNCERYSPTGEVPRPLLSAIRSNERGLLRVLIRSGAVVNGNAIYEAAAYGTLEIVQDLVESGFDMPKLGTHAICCAVSNKSFAIANYLLEAGVDIHERNNRGQFVIQLVAASGNLEFLKRIVDYGACINPLPSRLEGYTTLHFAVRCNHINIARYLLEKGVPIGPTDMNDLSRNQHQWGETVLEACVNPNVLDDSDDSDDSSDSDEEETEDGHSGWNHCDRYQGGYEWTDERSKLVKMLLQMGAPVSNPKPLSGYRPYNSVLTALIQQAATDIIPLVLNQNPDVNQAGRGKGARTALQAAAEQANLDMVQELVRRGANVNAPASAIGGRTALQAACNSAKVNAKLVKFLLQAGADVNARAGINGGITALQGAAIQGYIDIAKILLEHNADINGEAATENGRTAIEGAAEYGRLDMVSFLLEAGATNGMCSAIALAEFNGHFEIAKVLREYS